MWGGAAGICGVAMGRCVQEGEGVVRSWVCQEEWCVGVGVLEGGEGGVVFESNWAGKRCCMVEFEGCELCCVCRRGVGHIRWRRWGGWDGVAMVEC